MSVGLYSISNSLTRLLIFLASASHTQTGALGSRSRDDVTFGSCFKLVNSNKPVRLHSHDVKYGSGSGQQCVTGIDANDDVNSHWVVKSVSSTVNVRGRAVKCDSKIRLEHSTSSRNLHSENHQAPLSRNQEISAFGDNGEGNDGDVWELICAQSGAKTWKRGQPIRLRHSKTKVFLGLSGETFGRPISGEYEIVGHRTPDESSLEWTTAEGIFFHASEPLGKHESEHGDEL